MTRPVLRFAPSPNGRLHLGHAYSALLNDRVARALAGVWLLRIEDIDPLRANAANIEGVLEDLAWLGLVWPEPLRRQSQHMDLYRVGAERLRAQGLLYPCFCTRGQIADAVDDRMRKTGEPWPRDPDGAPLYPGTCRRLGQDAVAARIASGEPHAWRLDTGAAAAGLGPVVWRSFEPGGSEADIVALPERWGDPVVVRKDVPTSYHLSVVLDDEAQGVTHVVRGLDLLPATDLHALLAARLAIRSPCYHHHRLLTGPDDAKLSKSRGSESLATLRDAGVTAQAVRGQLGFT